MTGQMRRESYWLNYGDFQLLRHAHLPAGEFVAASAVLISGPLGFEAVHAHRSLVFLTDEFARNGFAAFRFDFRGTGNSSEDAHCDELVDRRHQNVISQIDDIRNQ